MGTNYLRGGTSYFKVTVRTEVPISAQHADGILMFMLLQQEIRLVLHAPCR
jgi:hypothetical protein